MRSMSQYAREHPEASYEDLRDHYLGRADNARQEAKVGECPYCGSYRIDGRQPSLHKENCPRRTGT